MASCGALLLCAIVFLSVAYLACPCPRILQEYPCTGSIPEESWCGDHLLRCHGSSWQIQFASNRGKWYDVVGEEDTPVGHTLEIEDPDLSPIFRGKDCEFMYTFSQPGPLFAPPPQAQEHRLPDFSAIYCNISTYFTPLLSERVALYWNGGPCPAYVVVYSTEEERDLPATCLSSPHPPGVVWKLSVVMNSGYSDLAIVSVGFSRRRRLDRACFYSAMTRGHYEYGSPQNSTCTHRSGRRINKGVIMGICIPAGFLLVAGILLSLWFRRKKVKTLPASSTSFSRSVSTEPFSEEDPEAARIQFKTRVFTYEELHEATKGFSASNELDHGGHGTVYKGKLRDGRVVAIKRLHHNSRRRAELFMNEIAVLSRLCHPNLVTLYGCTSSPDLLLAYELVPNGTVADHLHGNRALTWPLRLRIAVETATALAYLHAVKPPVVHRDVKTKNILLDQDFHVKVADFGLSRLFPVSATHVSTVPQGTPGYVDPEYHRCHQLTDKSDVYSFGVVLAELISSKPAVDVARSRHEINLGTMAFHKIHNATLRELVDPKLGYEMDLEVSREIELVANLAMRCLQDEREDRPTMEDVRLVLGEIQDRCQQADKGGEVSRQRGS